MGRLILPPSTIGIIGGGQLGRMLAIAAKMMGYKIAVLDPNRNSPCGQVADYIITAPFDDERAYHELMDISDVITYEFENVPARIIRKYQDLSYIPQGYRPLMISQNRLLEKTVINDNGFRTAPFLFINSASQLMDGIVAFNYPCILKTTEGGYDGKGQVLIKNTLDIEKALPLLSVPCILEKFIGFKKEISIIVTRSTNDEIAVFPVSENIHINNILHKTIVPARISAEADKKASDLAVNLIRRLDLIGTIAIEMFLLNNDEILINEIAPRVHNSAHYSIEACSTSQFEQHIRAICGLKLGGTALIKNAVMVNILGKDLPLAAKLLESGVCKVHLYGKEQILENRKMGHVTFLGDNQALLLDKVTEYINKGVKDGLL